MIRISIVVPCRELTPAIEQLDALALQRWDGEWEVIVANNGSADPASLLARYGQRLPRLRVVDAAAQRGAGFARNTGARAATHEYLAFCDADDEVAPDWLAGLAAALAQHDFVASRFDCARLNTRPVQQYVGNPQREGVQRLWYAPYLPHAGASGLGVRRECHERIGGFDETLVAVEDTDYCVRMQRAGVPLGFASGAVMCVRRRATYRGVFRQARILGEYNTLLAQRYRDDEVPDRSWTRLARQTFDALRLLAAASGARSRAQAVYQVGWTIGLLIGSIKHLTVPAVVVPLPVGPGAAVLGEAVDGQRARSV